MLKPPALQLRALQASAWFEGLDRPAAMLQLPCIDFKKNQNGKATQAL